VNVATEPVPNGPDAVTEVHRPPQVPDATTSRFVLLIVAVLASSAFVFLEFYVHLPGKGDHVIAVREACDARLVADPAMAAPPQTLADVQNRQDAVRRWQVCHLPLLADQVVVIGAGIAVLFGLAVTSYLLHPWWLIRRRRLRPIVNAPNLLGTLEQLRQEAGLTRAVDWRLAPHARTTGGQAFGLPWRRSVQIDAGLAVMHAVNRPAFRAVVLHELGHLRSRDVDKTYLTIGVWRAFVAVAVIPFVAMLLHPGLLIAPLDWRWRDSTFAVRPARPSPPWPPCWCSPRWCT
jgi:hypothetical protein